MIGYAVIGANDLDASLAFWDAVTAAMGKMRPALICGPAIGVLSSATSTSPLTTSLNTSPAPPL